MGKQSKIEILLSARDTGFSSGIGKATKGLHTLQGQAKSLQTTLSGLSSVKLAIGGIVGGAAGYYANQVRQIADEYTNLNSRVRLVSDSEAEFATVQELLYQISQETGTAFAGNAEAYAKLARAVKNLGGNSQEALQITELVNKSLIVNGSTSAMAAAFMLQFAQSMGKGKLDGDEFTSMLENNAYFANELAKALKTDMAGLLEMREAGELTADRLRAAFPKMAQEITDAFGKIAPTTSRAWTMLENVYKRIINDADQASGGTGKISSSVIHLAQTIDQRRDGIINLFSFMITMAAGATDKIVRLSEKIGNIGQSFSGWGAVFDGKLNFFDFATMDAKELNEWLIKNTQAAKAIADAAKMTGNDVSRSATQTANTQKKVTGDALKEMTKMYKDYAKEVDKLQGDLGDHQRSAEEELREMKRSGMSDLGAWRDRKKEAGEFTQKAREAAEAAKKLFAAGNVEAGRETYKVAAEYADKASAAYKDLNEEVKRGDQVLIGQGTALRIAMNGVRTAGEVKADIIRQQTEALQGAQDALNKQSGGQLDKSIEQTKANITDLAKVIQESSGDWGKVWEAMKTNGQVAFEDINKAAAGQKEHIVAVEKEWVRAAPRIKGLWIEMFDELGRKIDAVTKPRTVTVYTNVVDNGIKRATGGPIPGLARGGRLPGYGGGDKVRALLEPGEFVVRKEAVSRYGTAYLQALNEMRVNDIGTVKANLGGLIARLNTSSAQRLQQGGLASSGPPEMVNLNLTLPGGVGPIPMKIGQNELIQLKRAERRAYQRRSTNNGW